MNTKTTITAALAGLLACSTPHPVQTTQPVSSLPALPEPLLEYEMYDGQLAPRAVLMPQICKLGTSCLAMDPRPFEPCLVSTKHCSGKAAEPLLVESAPSIIPATREMSR